MEPLTTTLGSTLPAAIDHMQTWGAPLRVAVEAIATVAFALSGMLEGARKRLDPVGTCVVGFLAAFGGGTLRDLLLDRRPFFWVQHVELVWLVIGLCVLSMVLLSPRWAQVTERAIQWPDAIGLGLFTASGVHVSLQAGMPALVAVLMGVITGTFGGVLRDIVCNEVPTVFKDHRPYALCAFAGAWVYVACWHGALPGWQALLASAAVTIGLRALALWRNWQTLSWRRQ